MQASLISVGSHASLERWCTVRWSDRDVKVISNLKALRLKRHGVICTFASRNCIANLFNPTHTKKPGYSKFTISKSKLTKLHTKPLYTLPVDLSFGVWVNNGKPKMCAFLSSFRIDFLHQACQFLQSCIHPINNADTIQDHKVYLNLKS